jgi:hypothetical protein
MTPQQALVWKRELTSSLEPAIERFNSERIREGLSDQSIETFDVIGTALGIRIVKTQYPSCLIELTFEGDRRPVVVIRCSRQRAEHVQRLTEERYFVLSPPDVPLKVDDVYGPLTVDELAEVVIGLVPVPRARAR